MSMKAPKLTTLLKVAVVLIWAGIFVYATVWFMDQDMTVRQLPRYFSVLVRSAGIWAPFVILTLFVARSLLFLPATAILIVCGTVYGPVWGSILSIFGLNLSASISYAMGKFLGRKAVRDNKSEWVKRYDELLTNQGFMSVLAMRILFFPFDVVNYGCSVTGMPYRQFLLGSLIGQLPTIVTLSVLGSSLTHPRSLALFFVLLGVTGIGVFFLQRSRWVRSNILEKKVKEHVV